LSCSLLDTDLLDLQLVNERIVSRIGVKVRDPDWDTVPGEVAPAEIQSADDGFSARVGARHRRGELDFEWTATVIGEPRGALTYAMDGVAHADFHYNRIGLCVLHAAPACAGRAYRARSPDGELRGRLPALVGPQRIEGETIFPLFPAFEELELELADGTLLRFEFEGDLFEIEDQRNWSDGSFKTYSTPLSMPVPHRCGRGERIRQRVRLRMGEKRRTAPRRAAGGQLTVEIGAPTGRKFPPVGLGLDQDGHEPSDVELGHLRRLAPAHLRVDLRHGGAEEPLARGARLAAALDARLELALTLDREDPAAGLDVVGAALAAQRSPLARALVLRARARVTDPADVGLVRERLGAAVRCPLIGGTDLYFAELNRERPAMDAVDGLAYPLTPQVHDTDETALVESLAAQADTVATARSFAAGKPVHVTPVTLKPRFNPFASDPVEVQPGQLPPTVDQRQPTTFAAAWTLGSIRRLAEAGAASLTYYELTGWRGVVEREGGTPLPERFPRRPGEPFPLFWVLASACALRGAEPLATTASDPLAIEALAARREGVLTVLVANLRPEPIFVRITGLPRDRIRAWWLDASRPGGLDGSGEELSAPGGRIELELDTWSVGRLSAGDES